MYKVTLFVRPLYVRLRLWLLVVNKLKHQVYSEKPLYFESASDYIQLLLLKK